MKPSDAAGRPPRRLAELGVLTGNVASSRPPPALGLAAMGSAVLAPGNSAGAADVATSKISWTACTGPSTPAGSECAFLDVPMDWGQPTGKQIQIALSGRRPPPSGKA